MSIFGFFGAGKFAAAIEKAKQETNAVLLDVRTKQEFVEDGHVENAVNFPLDTLAYARLDKNKKYYVYCYSGARSGAACAYLANNGYDAVNIGGIASYKGTLVKGA